MHGTPMLTTVDQSIHEMGALAAKLLISILQGEMPENTLCKIPTRLLTRESCQAPSS
jgi:DNA-binding LacI/PurR family transcriptional regulator